MPQNENSYIARYVNGVEIKREPGKFILLTGGHYKCECGALMSSLKSRYLHIKSYKHRIAVGELPVGFVSCGRKVYR